MPTPLTALFNTKLEEGVNDLAQQYPDAAFHFFDAFQLSHEIDADPASYGFTSGRVGVCGKYVAQCEGYVWQDLIHPAVGVHRLIADRAFAMLEIG